MRGVRFTKAEAALIREAVKHAGPCSVWSTGQLAARDRILEKLDEASAVVTKDSVSQPGAAKLQRALMDAARGKVVALEGGWPQAQRMAANVGATEETARLMGEWLARQGWLTSPLTLLDVLIKWHRWLPKAKACEAPPSLTPGFNASARPSAPAPGKAPAGGRSSPGLR